MRTSLPLRSLAGLSLLTMLAGCGHPPAEEAPETTGTAQQEVDTRLSCNLAFSYAPPATVNVGLIASQVTSVVGLSDSMGGVGVKLELVNNQYPTQYVNVVEPRSAAGAGWQTSYIIQDWPGGVGNIVFNQAAGNAVGSQWGYTNRYAFSGSVINSMDWNPLVSDHIHETGAAFSPCKGTGYLFDNGKVDVNGSLVNTSAGSVILWKNAYSFQSRMNQSWPSWSAEQALYLNKKVASMGNLRIYLKRGTTLVGPIRPVSRFSIPGATCVQNNGSACNTGPYDYAVLVWNIFGLDVGIAIPNLSNGISLNMEEVTYCANASDLTCGNISFHSWTSLGSVNIPAGAVRTVSRNYYIGTLPQLAALGYTIQ